MTTARVLIVEDERIIALNLKCMMEKHGYEVLATVPSGERAVKIAIELRPDLVLMDIHLAGLMDGIEAANIIHKALGVPVIFLTANADDETLRRAQSVPPMGYVIKPFDMPELHATIQMVLSRRAAERVIEDGRKQLELALDAGRFGVLEWDATTDRIHATGRLLELFGTTSQSIEESRSCFLTRLHSHDQAAFTAALQAGALDSPRQTIQFRVVADGEQRLVELHLRWSRGDAGQVRLNALIGDISERNLIEERLTQARVAFDTAAEGIFTLDHERRIVSVNPAFIQITGYSPEDLFGRNVDKVLHASGDNDDFYSAVEAAPEERWQGRRDCLRKNGTSFPGWESLSVVRDRSGAVLQYVGVFFDMTPLREAEERLAQLAHFDPLTGLPNRTLFADRLQQAVWVAERSRKSFAILFLDLDGFKDINDTLGHDFGDLLLQTMARRISAALRRSDSLFRIGGDEFVVIVRDLDEPQSAENVARKVIESIAAPVDLNGEAVSVSGSVGIALYPQNGTDRHQLLKAADAAMYRAKQTCRGTYAFFTKELAERSTERLRVERGLRRAIESPELVLHYQPMVTFDSNWSTGRLSGLEALVRWHHPERGLLAPSCFISIAEQTGLIAVLGRRILRDACMAAAAWQREGGMQPRVSVNVSARQLILDRFDLTVREMLDASGLRAADLEIEITESTLQELESSRKILGTLRDLGVSIAVDDFGTGYSSLSVLKHLPINRLKIDRSFVSDIDKPGSDRAIIQTIVGLSRALDLNIVAEGVETIQQFRVLQDIGCQEMQGYLFGKGVPIADLHERLTAQSSWLREAA